MKFILTVTNKHPIFNCILFLTIACAIIISVQYEPIKTATLMTRSEVGTVVATISIVH